MIDLTAASDELLAVWEYDTEHFADKGDYVCGKIYFDIVDTTGTTSKMLKLEDCTNSDDCNMSASEDGTFVVDF
jgi:hypothetical protein